MRLTDNTTDKELSNILNGRPNAPTGPQPCANDGKNYFYGVFKNEDLYGIVNILRKETPPQETIRLALDRHVEEGNTDALKTARAALGSAYYDVLMALDASDPDLAIGWCHPWAENTMPHVAKPYVAPEPEPELTRTEEIRKLAARFETEPVWRLRTMVAQGVNGPDEYKTLHDIIDASHPRYMSKFEEVVGLQVLERIRA